MDDGQGRGVAGILRAACEQARFAWTFRLRRNSSLKHALEDTHEF
jgi:hypothetical protein